MKTRPVIVIQGEAKLYLANNKTLLPEDLDLENDPDWHYVGIARDSGDDPSVVVVNLGKLASVNIQTIYPQESKTYRRKVQ